MRRYDDPVEVRRGSPTGSSGGPGTEVEGAPAQFLWHGRLWKVRAVVAHWVETGAWWTSAGARAVIGTDDPEPVIAQGAGQAVDLLAERELWRVEAGAGAMADGSTGVFDLAFDWSRGDWQLVGCQD